MRIIPFVSAVFLCGEMMKTTPLSMASCAVLCVLIILVLNRIHGFPRRIYGILGAFLSLLWCYPLFRRFTTTWAFSSKLEFIAALLRMPYSRFLFLLGILVSFLSFPAIWILTSFFLQHLTRVIRQISWREILKGIFHNQDGHNAFSGGFGLLFRLALAICLGTGLLCLSFSVYGSATDSHMLSSAEVIAKEGKYPSLYSWCHSWLDNYTDSLLLLEASHLSDSSPLDQSMQIYYGGIEDNEPTEILIMHYLDNQSFDHDQPYPRYWHGSVVLLRPLLAITDYHGIRVMNLICQSILTAAVCILAFLRDRRMLLPLLLTWAMLMPLTLWKSLQYSSCFYVMMAALLVLLLMRKEHLTGRRISAFFLYIGIVTAYFDLLTYPIATFGTVAAVYVHLIHDRSMEDRLSRLIRAGFCWCMGYAGMWASKWLLSSLITGENVFADAFLQFSLRTSGTDYDGISRVALWEVLERNLDLFFFTPVALICLGLVIFLILRSKPLTWTNAFDIFLPYFLIALLPVVWYTFASNHSYVHGFFTCKALSVTILSLALWLSTLWSMRKNDNG